MQFSFVIVITTIDKCPAVMSVTPKKLRYHKTRNTLKTNSNTSRWSNLIE